MGSCVGKCWCSCCHFPSCLWVSTSLSASKRRFFIEKHDESSLDDHRTIIAASESTTSSTIGLFPSSSSVSPTQQRQLHHQNGFMTVWHNLFSKKSIPITNGSSKRSVCFAGKSTSLFGSSSSPKSSHRKSTSSSRRKSSCNMIPCTANSLTLRGKRSGSDSSFEFEHLVYDSFDIPVRIAFKTNLLDYILRRMFTQRVCIVLTTKNVLNYYS